MSLLEKLELPDITFPLVERQGSGAQRPEADCVSSLDRNVHYHLSGFAPLRGLSPAFRAESPHNCVQNVHPIPPIYN